MSMHATELNLYRYTNERFRNEIFAMSMHTIKMNIRVYTDMAKYSLEITLNGSVHASYRNEYVRV